MGGKEFSQLIASAWKDIGEKKGGSRGEKKGVKEHNAHQKRVNSNAPIRVWAGTRLLARPTLRDKTSRETRVSHGLVSAMENEALLHGLII